MRGDKKGRTSHLASLEHARRSHRCHGDVAVNGESMNFHGHNGAASQQGLKRSVQATTLPKTRQVDSFTVHNGVKHPEKNEPSGKEVTVAGEVGQ